MDARPLCSVCQDNEAVVVYAPCNHMTVCKSCQRVYSSKQSDRGDDDDSDATANRIVGRVKHKNKKKKKKKREDKKASEAAPPRRCERERTRGKHA
jgi:hypothetical protein